MSVRESLLRTLSVAILVLGLVPGMTTGLLPQALGFAHCDHSCCVGQDHCVRGTGHSHGTEEPDATASAGDAHHAHHAQHQDGGARAAASVDSVSSLDAPSENCRETCGVLIDGASARVSVHDAGSLTLPSFRASAPPAPFVARSTGRSRSTAPRAPPLS